MNGYYRDKLHSLLGWKSKISKRRELKRKSPFEFNKEGHALSYVYSVLKGKTINCYDKNYFTTITVRT